MVHFFESAQGIVFTVDSKVSLMSEDIEKLKWLFGNAQEIKNEKVSGFFVGPRKEMITPWSTNAVEICQNMGVFGIFRIEEFYKVSSKSAKYDPMLQAMYENVDQSVFSIDRKPEPIVFIDNITEYNKKEGLALNEDEIAYLESLPAKLGRKLTDSEIFGFSQVNSEHCRHKIFNGTFIIDGVEKPSTLFQLIKKTTKENNNRVVSAYKDNCAFIDGPKAEQFAPKNQDRPDFFEVKDIDTVLSIKAETHNFPTTVEPFNGAATGAGGEIRDRIAGGKGAFPVAGTAIYMTSYARTEEGREWEKNIAPRNWLYQKPDDILVKASNGASDFGNKYGQPLICGSVLTFEHLEAGKKYGFDKVIMLAGGIGYGKKQDSLKDTPRVGDKVVLLGGDNYRIGMGGGAVSSVATGEYGNKIELNAVQRSNPEMQKRAYNAIRALSELDHNPIISIHDHGAGGHLNCLSELVEATGGTIDISKLPVGDPTLSAKEIVGNESQERMGLVMHENDIELLKNIADRERAPMYVIGETTGDHQFTFKNPVNGEKPIDLKLEDMFGNPPKTIMRDNALDTKYSELKYDVSKVYEYLESILQLEGVACKDWLTNKVDRSVTGKIATQQTSGPLQLPLNNLGVINIDYAGHKGMATSLGHAPAVAMIDSMAGSVMAIAESLTNIVWAPIEGGLKGVSLSANWMWPCKNEGEDARLYDAVKAASDFALGLSINIPTGKDSLSMTQKYPDGSVVFSPGTVIITAAGEVKDIRKTISPVVMHDSTSKLLYIDFSGSAFELGGSSFAQVINQLGTKVPKISSAEYFAKAFEAVQQLVENKAIVAGHDISSGGIVTSLLEMCFADNTVGIDVNLSALGETDDAKLLFSENPGVIIQTETPTLTLAFLIGCGVRAFQIGSVTHSRTLNISNGAQTYSFDIDKYRDKWYKTSYLLDKKQSGEVKALERYQSYKKHELSYIFPENFTGKASQYGIDLHRRKSSGVKAAIIREKGVNGDREMAWMMYLAGLDVKDVHMTDLIAGRETLEDINLIVFVGGFSNSDVLGSAKGWAGAFLYNPKARQALDNFYARPDTMSLGVCNGCQLVIELGLITPDHADKPKMLHNESHKFESGFINVNVEKNQSIMLNSLSGTRLGIWIAHGEGKFELPYDESRYNIVMKYSYASYPANPNGSKYNTAGICSNDGRHLAMMPHLERATYPWNWPYYMTERNDEVSPWIEAFVNAREWIKKNKK